MAQTISDETQKQWKQRLSKSSKGDLIGRLIMAYTTIMNLEKESKDKLNEV
jgi:hypothetical protein